MKPKLLGVAALLCIGVTNAQGYTFTPVDDPLGTNGTFPLDINNAGQIVGNYIDSNGNLYGFLDNNGTYTTINDPSAGVHPGGFSTYAHSINNLGQIVGYYVDSNGGVHGFLYSGGTNGTYATLNDPSAYSGSGNGTVTFGINNSGQIVGYSSRAFLYSGGTNGTYTTINGTTGFTSPLGVNDLGQIVGYYVDGKGNNQAFLDSNGTHILSLFQALAAPTPLPTASMTPAKSSAGILTVLAFRTPSFTAVAPTPRSLWAPRRASTIMAKSSVWRLSRHPRRRPRPQASPPSPFG
jgi:probable HAF family extracellular repeat protein